MKNYLFYLRASHLRVLGYNSAGKGCESNYLNYDGMADKWSSGARLIPVETPHTRQRMDQARRQQLISSVSYFQADRARPRIF